MDVVTRLVCALYDLQWLAFEIWYRLRRHDPPVPKPTQYSWDIWDACLPWIDLGIAYVTRYATHSHIAKPLRRDLHGWIDRAQAAVAYRNGFFTYVAGSWQPTTCPGIFEFPPMSLWWAIPEENLACQPPWCYPNMLLTLDTVSSILRSIQQCQCYTYEAQYSLASVPSEMSKLAAPAMSLWERFDTLKMEIENVLATVCPGHGSSAS